MQTEIAARAASATVQPTERATILIVDGNAGAADTLSADLARYCLHSVIAHSASELFEQVRRDKPQAIVLDARLPDADGFALAQQFQHEPELCDIPLIVLSATLRPDITRRACPVGCQFFVRKPCDIKSLVALIGRVLAEVRS